jgi:hypothetical protein
MKCLLIGLLSRILYCAVSMRCVVFPADRLEFEYFVDHARVTSEQGLVGFHATSVFPSARNTQLHTQETKKVSLTLSIMSTKFAGSFLAVWGGVSTLSRSSFHFRHCVPPLMPLRSRTFDR